MLLWSKSRLLMVTTLALCLFLPLTMAANITCLSDKILQVNTTYYINRTGNVTPIEISKEIYCPYDCTNGTCEGTSPESSTSSVWIVYGIGTVMLILGTAIALFGRFMKLGGEVGGEKTGLSKYIDTTMIVKYMFFFIGLFLLYLSLGMARRTASVFGSETNIISGVDTATMVVMLTIGFFLIVFLVEFLFSILNMYREWTIRKKWGEREIGGSE